MLGERLLFLAHLSASQVIEVGVHPRRVVCTLSGYARRNVSFCEELMDWAAQTRGIKARPEYARLAEIAAQFADLPLQLMRSFFYDLVQEISALPARIAAGRAR